jgi:uncharacterized membrane protein YdjX (TVP38/TMEM64 family)
VTHHPLHIRRLLVLAFVLAVVVGAARSDAVHGAIVGVLEISRGLMEAYPRGGMIIFLALSALSAMLSFFSSSALVPIGVYVWGPARTALLLYLGGTLGGIAGYWISRSLGRRIVNALVAAAPLARYEEYFQHHAKWRTVLLFRIALQSELPSYVLGLVRYPFRRYLPIILLAEIPYVIIVVYLGESFLERNTMLFGAVLTGAVLLSLVAWRSLQREMRASEAARES